MHARRPPRGLIQGCALPQEAAGQNAWQDTAQLQQVRSPLRERPASPSQGRSPPAAAAAPKTATKWVPAALPISPSWFAVRRQPCRPIVVAWLNIRHHLDMPLLKHPASSVLGHSCTAVQTPHRCVYPFHTSLHCSDACSKRSALMLPLLLVPRDVRCGSIRDLVPANISGYPTNNKSDAGIQMLQLLPKKNHKQPQYWHTARILRWVEPACRWVR